MHPDELRQRGSRMLHDGRSASEVARELGVPRSTVRGWIELVARPAACPRCGDAPLDPAAYTALLGYYLGDGCVSRAARTHVLRVSCDATLPGIVRDVRTTIQRVRPDGVIHLVGAPGATVVHSAWKHWPCLFPQHGPGRKHEREIRLAPWQRDVVTAHPGPFLRGLFHSDGCRVRNWATRTVAGETKRYDYPRWQFSNRSEDILGLCTWALDLAGIAWRRSGPWTVSVSRREAVAELDRLIGPKS